MDKKTKKIICSENTGIEGEAIRQLEYALSLDHMTMAYGMPDIHPGKGYPIGASFLAHKQIYPYLIGNDIGCGMSFFKTDLKKLKQDKTLKKIKSIESPLDEELALSFFKEEEAKFIYSLGTVGGGNHFAEFQSIDNIIDENLFSTYELEKNAFYLLVHSGSRGLGESILRKHIDKHKDAGLSPEQSDFATYMKEHDYALRWAKLNREVIAYRFAEQLKFNYEKISDIEHNFIERIGNDYIHRKGAIPSNKGLVVIPGSRGHHSYLIEPKKAPLEASLYSLSHGAGRKWKRSEAKSRLSHKYRVNDLQKTKIGSRVICEDKKLLYEEAPMVYKNISSVIQDLVDAELINVIATLKPLISYKKKKLCC